MAYRVILSKSAAKELDAIPSKSHDKIVEHLRQLEADPRIFGSEKLNDASKEVRVFMVEDRKQVYKRLKRK